MRVMYDTVTPSNIPRDAEMVAGYPYGHYETWKYLTKHFKHAVRLSIAIRANETDCMILDCERGDVDPTTSMHLIEGWVLDRRGKGKPVIVYAARDNMESITKRIRLAESEIWSAHILTDRKGRDIPHVCGPHTCGASFTAGATQWTFTAKGKNLDESMVTDAFHDRLVPKSKRKSVHPKVVASTLSALIVTGILHAAHTRGVHVDATETGVIASVGALVAGYLRRG